MEISEKNEKKEVILVGKPTAIDHKAFVLENEVDLVIKKIPNGFDALKMILTADQKPSLMIVDLLSDRLNGLHFCYILKRILEVKDVKVILFSEHSHRNNIIKGIQSGAADYIIDPCSDVLFKDRVLYHLYDNASVDDAEGQDGSENVDWKFLTYQRKDIFEYIFVERVLSDTESDIWKLSRNLKKKDFTSISFGKPEDEEFEFAMNKASGDLSRFNKGGSFQTEQDWEVKRMPVQGDEDLDNETVFSRKLDVYNQIEPHEKADDKRDKLLTHDDLSKIAGENVNLKVLLDINQEVNTNPNPRDCMVNVINQISKFIENVRASIIVPSENLKHGTVLVANDDHSLENLRISLNDYPEITKSIDSGEIVFIEDAMSSDLLKDVRSKLEHLSYSSIIVVPIWSKSRVIAVLSIRGKSGGKEVTLEDVAFCQIIASTTARTIAGKVFLQKIMSKFIPAG